MQIIVPIKQVPETGNVKMDEKTGTMIREGVESIINPLDLYAIEEALRLKEEHEGSVTVISMGPAKAEEALREAIAMGCDRGVLLTAREFAGSDTWATAYALALAIKKIGNFDLILCGERATDGETGQVGPGIASYLNLPLGTYISSIVKLKGSSLRVKRLVENGYVLLEILLPALLTVVKEISYPRLPTLRGKQRAKKINILRMGPVEIQAEIENLGLQGSPTRVVKIFKPRLSRQGEKFMVKDESDLEQAVEKIIDFLEQRQLI
ncbi:MAG: electron transfer flavoprotein subunit beta/FixA family protein [Firmicutes bacterium]|nr:electron transfer flavoprotein subunit beta/FixA family protein [Bacillota bacterium]